MRLPPLIACACALAGAVSACGSSTHSTPASAPVTGAPVETAPATTSTPATAATVAAPVRRRCTGAELSARFIGQQGAAGHGELGFAVRNTGSVTCHTYGFPGVLFLDRDGRPLPTASTRVTHDLFGSAPEVSLALAPGDSASFRLGVTHGLASSAGCVTAYAVQVIAPDDTASIRAQIPDGAYECGTATVSPLQPGRSAYP